MLGWHFRKALISGSAATAILTATPVMAIEASGVTAQPTATEAAAAGQNTAPKAPTGANGPSGPATTLPEVVVTAEKRSANIQNVPLAVTAFTSKERALEGINTVQDITNFTPGLTYSSQLDRPAIRGLQRSTNVYLADSSVGIYDNDLFTNSTSVVGRDDMIVDQVEVLEGPQNTLYGRNAIGGIINTQSKRPSDVFGGEVRTEAGNYGYTKNEATITGPLSFLIPNLTARLSGYYDSQDQGYIHNLTGKDVEGAHHDSYVELQLQYEGDRDDLWFESYYATFNQDRGGPGSSEGTPGVGPYDTTLVQDGALFYNPNYPYGGGAVPGSVVGAVPGGVNPSTKSNRVTAFRQDLDLNTDDSFTLNFHWIHHFDGFDVKYVGGYTQYHYQELSNNFLEGDSSIESYQLPVSTLAQVSPQAGNFCGTLPLLGGACSPLTVDGNHAFTFDATSHWYSHEIDFTSTTKGPFSWIAGLYYYNEHDNNPEAEQASGQPQLNASGFNVIPLGGAAGYITTLFNQALSGGPPPALAPFNAAQAGDYLFLDYQSMTQSTAGFVQASYKITDTIKLTGGFRYTYDRKDGQEEARYIDFANVLPANLLGQYTPAVDITSLLTSTAPGKGIASAVTSPTTGKYAGDAVRKLADQSSAPTGTAALEWTPDRDTLAYARYSRGYKAFAFNAGYVGPNPEAAPEFVNDYEVGIKKTINHNIQIDINGFYYDYSNDQVPLAFPVNGSTVLLTQFVNIPKAVSDGVELTALWNPIPHWNLSLTYGFDHTEIQTGCASFTTPLSQSSGGCFIDAADPLAQAKGAQPRGPASVAESSTGQPEVFQSVKGDPLPQAPANKVALNSSYTWFFEPGNLTVSGSYIWRDHDYSSIFQRTQYDYAPSWSQVDLRATFSGDHDHYEVVFYVKNLFNTIGFDDAAGGGYVVAPQGGGHSTYAATYDLTPPRLFGGELHYKF